MLHYGRPPEQRAQPDCPAVWPWRVALRREISANRPESGAPCAPATPARRDFEIKKPSLAPAYGLKVPRAPNPRLAVSETPRPRPGVRASGAARAGRKGKPFPPVSYLFFPLRSLCLSVLYSCGSRWERTRNAALRGRRPFSPFPSPPSQTAAPQREASQKVCSGAAQTGARGVGAGGRPQGPSSFCHRRGPQRSPRAERVWMGALERAAGLVRVLSPAPCSLSLAPARCHPSEFD